MKKAKLNERKKQTNKKKCDKKEQNEKKINKKKKIVFFFFEMNEEIHTGNEKWNWNYGPDGSTFTHHYNI